MKKKLLILSFLFLAFAAFAEESPIESGGWHWDSGVTLNGKWFYDVAESYKEQDGWAYIEGFGKIH